MAILAVFSSALADPNFWPILLETIIKLSRNEGLITGPSLAWKHGSEAARPLGKVEATRSDSGSRAKSESGPESRGFQRSSSPEHVVSKAQVSLFSSACSRIKLTALPAV